ncbi:MAG: imidazole glycerol phosphate synthase subunit HisH [Fuerstiella sp.]|nr:imidazole glycerol phosphate synthase subunit HisH [Fuerstiella sp.]MCP4858877.1 imidazole glycerol phosphate synthase subunit HisH [Fuerstiella sp.]
MIGIVDYGLGNLASIQNMFRRLESQSVVSADVAELAECDRLILPGVGSFDRGVRNLHESGLWEPLNRWVLDEKKPILGICLGVQLLTEGSDEGTLPGLGWIAGRTVSFDTGALSSIDRIPNMGWRYVDVEGASSLSEGLPDDPRFYFVHSFHLQCENPEDVILSAAHGYTFAAGVERGNIAGVQFHPEKSHKFGMALLRNFACLQPQ